MSVVILIPQARSLCADVNIGECPAFDNTHTDRFGVHLELDELHGVLKDLLTRVEILDLDRVADRTPIVLDYHVLKCTELPEYEAVMDMYGVGKILGSQLIAEIGDIRKLHSGKALVAMAGIDPPPHQSGTVDTRSRSISKRGSPALRKTLFQVIGVYLQRQPKDEPVYQFLEKKRTEGKPYKVYMIAAAHKFLRIYYARIKEVMPKQ